MSKRIVLTTTVLLLLVVGALPVLSMLLKSFLVDGHFDLTSYHGVFTSPRQWTLMKNSLTLALMVTFGTLVLGVPLGILLGKTRLPLRRFFTILFSLPLLIPPYIVAISWFDLLGTRGLAGCVLVLSTIYLPIPMLLTLVFLGTVNPRLEEAGRLVSGWPGVLKSVTLPLLWPGIMLGAMVVFLLSFGEFSVPNFLRYPVFPVESFTQFSAFYDFRAATAATVPLVVVTLLLLGAEAAFLRDRTYQPQPFPQHERLPLISLGRWRSWLTAGVACLGLGIVVVPLLDLVLRSGGWPTYEAALRLAGDSLFRSLVYAVSGATILAALGFLTGYLIHQQAMRFWRAVDSLTVFLFALPGTVLGIGLIGLWNAPGTNFVYSTPLIIIVGYLAKYTVLTSRVMVAQLARIPRSMEEAAEAAGASWPRRMLMIVGPLARRGLLAAWLIGYIFSLRDTGITMLVYPAGHETLPVRIFTLMANGSPQLIAALCVIMITATLLPVGLLWLLPTLREKR